MANESITEHVPIEIGDVLEEVARLQQQIHAKTLTSELFPPTLAPLPQSGLDTRSRYPTPPPQSAIVAQKGKWLIGVAAIAIALTVIFDLATDKITDNNDNAKNWKFDTDIKKALSLSPLITTGVFAEGTLQLHQTTSSTICDLKTNRTCYTAVAVHKSAETPQPLPSLEEINLLMAGKGGSGYPRVTGYVPYRHTYDLTGYQLMNVWETALQSNVAVKNFSPGTGPWNKAVELAQKNPDVHVLRCRYASENPGSTYYWTMHWYKNYPANGDLKSIQDLGEQNPFINVRAPRTICPGRKPD